MMQANSTSLAPSYCSRCARRGWRKRRPRSLPQRCGGRRPPWRARCSSGPSMDYLKGLADGFGGRLSGSPSRRSAEWAAGSSAPGAQATGELEARRWRPRRRAAPRPPARARPSSEGSVSSRSAGRPRPHRRRARRGRHDGPTSRPKLYVEGHADKRARRGARHGRLRAGQLQGLPPACKSPPIFKDAGAPALVFPGARPTTSTPQLATWGTTLSLLPAASSAWRTRNFIERLLTEQPARPVTVEFVTTTALTGGQSRTTWWRRFRAREAGRMGHRRRASGLLGLRHGRAGNGRAARRS